jgi:hypothetical protein
MHARIHVEGEDEFVVQSMYMYAQPQSARHNNAEQDFSTAAAPAVRTVVFRRTDATSKVGHGNCGVRDDAGVERDGVTIKARSLGDKHDSLVHGGSPSELVSGLTSYLSQMLHMNPNPTTEANPLSSSVSPASSVASGATTGRSLQSAGGALRPLEILIFNSNSRYKQFGVGVTTHTSLLLGLVQELYSEYFDKFVSNGAIFVRFYIVGMFTFTDSDPAILNTGQRQTYLDDGLVNVNQLLPQFRTLVGGMADLPRHDLHHMLHGSEFFSSSSEDGTGNDDDLDTSVIGLAYVAAACTASRTGVTQANSLLSLHTATVMAHEIGHNLVRWVWFGWLVFCGILWCADRMQTIGYAS